MDYAKTIEQKRKNGTDRYTKQQIANPMDKKLNKETNSKKPTSLRRTLHTTIYQHTEKKRSYQPTYRKHKEIPR